MLVVAALRGAVADLQGIVTCSVGEPGAVLAAVPAAGTPVVVLGEQRDEAALRQQATLLSDRDGGRPVAVRAWPHSPLAVLALATWICEQGVTDDGQAMAELDVAAAHTLSAAWIRRVGGLDSPAPSLGQHLRSWSPTASGFVVVHSPRQGVYPVGAAPTSVEWPGGLDVRRGALFVGGEAPAPVLEWAKRAAGVADSVPVPAFSQPAQRYGTERAVEMCALPADPRTVLAARADASRCPVCSLHTPLGSCAFCKRTSAPIALEGAA